jgi:aminoglycoside 2''-phosphotransferase
VIFVTAALADLEARIRAAFPALEYEQAVFNTYGEDNYVVVLDSRWIVRFPRSDAQRWRFIAELSLLDALCATARVAVPRYEWVAPEKAFGAYRLIEGREMTPPVYAALRAQAQQTLLAKLGAFLSDLHALPEETLRLPDGALQRCWTGAAFATYYRGMRRAMIEPVVSASSLARFDAFHEAFAVPGGGVDRVCHGDLSDDHILIGSDNRLAGIIDFTDAAWGDPAIDFAYLWRMGEEAVDIVLSHYALATADPGVKDRARWTFVRYLINQISYGARAKWNLSVEEALAELEPHLRWCGV